MSGIVGVVNWDQEPVKTHELEQMVEKLYHRGPHGKGVWVQDFCGFGHTLLFNSPESVQEKLPATSSDGNLVITADVRLDNREELIEALGMIDRNPENITDSDLILEAYQAWGKICPQKLLGDFAFVIWDTQTQQIFCARDHIGCKPFVYYLAPGIFAFASEVKGLFPLKKIPRIMNEGRIADFLLQQLECIDQTSTFYENIFRLPPAHTLTITAEKSCLECYWILDATKEIYFSSDEEYEQAFLEIFTEAVRCRLRSHSPVGSMLSGGLDSSSIVCIARAMLLEKGELLHTFSGVSDDRETCYESPFVEAIIAKGGLDAQVIRADDIKPFIPDVQNMLAHSDDLFNFVLHGLTSVSYSSAKSKGIHVMMTGLDGDGVISQKEIMLMDLLCQGKFYLAYKEAQAMSKFSDLWWKISPVQFLWKYGIKPLAPQAIKNIYRSIISQKKKYLEDSLILPEFAQKIDMEERLKTLSTNLGEQKRFKNAKEAQHNYLSTPLVSVALERYERVAAFFSIEPRHPILDKRLVEFCLALPNEQKVRQGWTKSILRRSMEGKMPELVRWRIDRKNIQPRFTANMLLHQQEYLTNLLKEYEVYLKNYVDLKKLAEKYRLCYDNDTIDTSVGWDLWSTIILGKWIADNIFSP